MNAREKIVNRREEMSLSITDAARQIGISAILLEYVENGQVTHPRLAKKIGRYFNLSKQEIEELVPKNHRQSNKDYDPEKYVIKRTKSPKVCPAYDDSTFIERYMSEHVHKQLKDHKKLSRY